MGEMLRRTMWILGLCLALSAGNVSAAVLHENAMEGEMENRFSAEQGEAEIARGINCSNSGAQALHMSQNRIGGKLRITCDGGLESGRCYGISAMVKADISKNRLPKKLNMAVEVCGQEIPVAEAMILPYGDFIQIGGIYHHTEADAEQFQLVVSLGESGAFYVDDILIEHREILKVVPENGSENLPLNPYITVWFGEKADCLSINENTVILNGEPAEIERVTPMQDGTQVRILLSGLAANSRYELKLQQIKKENGDFFAPYTLYFQTRKKGDNLLKNGGVENQDFQNEGFENPELPAPVLPWSAETGYRGGYSRRYAHSGAYSVEVHPLPGDQFNGLYRLAFPLQEGEGKYRYSGWVRLDESVVTEEELLLLVSFFDAKGKEMQTRLASVTLNGSDAFTRMSAEFTPPPGAAASPVPRMKLVSRNGDIPFYADDLELYFIPKERLNCETALTRDGVPCSEGLLNQPGVYQYSVSVLENGGTSPQKLTACLALYRNGVLADISSDSTEIQPGMTSGALQTQIDVKGLEDGIYTIKAFLWEGLNSLIPLK